MILYPFLLILTSMLSLILGIIVFQKKQKDSLHILFLVFCIISSFLTFTLFMNNQVSRIELAVFWMKANSFWHFILAVQLHFILAYTGKTKLLKNKIIIALIYLPAILLSYFDFTGIYNPVREYLLWASNAPVRQSLILFDTLWSIGVGILSVILCYLYYIKTKDRIKKQQIKIVTLGFASPLLIGFLSYGLLGPLGIKIPNLTSISMGILVLFIGFGMWKYRLFSLNPSIVADEILSTMSNFLFLVDHEGIIQSANQAAINLFGYQGEELLGNPISMICESAKNEDCILNYKNWNKESEKGTINNKEIYIKGKNKQLVPVLLSLSYIKDKKGWLLGIVCTGSDLTEEKKKDFILMENAKLATMGDFLKNISHQWRQPMNIIGIIIQNIQLYYENGILTGEYLNKSVNKAMNLILLMSQTIDEFRKFFQSDAHKISFSLKESVEKTVRFIQENAEDYFSLSIIKNNYEDCILYGYPGEFQQAILNILNNSVEILLERKISGPQISINIYYVNNRVFIEINDNGGGIKEEVIDRIFEPYFTTKEKGIGIGLYISKMIVEKKMNGCITVQNTLNGAQFKIECGCSPSLKAYK